RGQRKEHVARRHHLHAIRRARDRNEIDLDARFREPAELHRDRERSRGRGHGARAPADAQRGFRGGGCNRGERRRQSANERRADLLHPASPLAGAISPADFTEGSQNSTRFLTSWTQRLSASPTTAKIMRIENWPATS